MADDFIERNRLQNLLQVAVQRYPLAGIQNGVVGKILRSIGLVGRNHANEFFLRHRLQRVIHAPLISKRRNRVRGKLLAAKRACAVRRVDQGLIGQRQQLVVQRVVKMRAQIVGGPSQRGPQVRPAHVADEQRIAGENGVRLCRVLLSDRTPECEMDSMVWPGVSRTCTRRPGNSSVSPSRHRHKGILRLGARAKINRRAATIAQLQVPGDEIGMEMGQKNVADLQTESLRVRHVLFDIALRIDDDRSASWLRHPADKRRGPDSPDNTV